MPSIAFERTVDRRVRAAFLQFGLDVRRLREDAGLSRAELAAGVGVDASYLADIEAGGAKPSHEVSMRLAIGLGGDAPLRLYPTTGPAIRDRHQTPIAESLVRELHARWRSIAEVGVTRPSRGWIDLALIDSRSPTLVATEVESDLRRVEQQVRWAQAKADSVPSWEGWHALGGAITVSRLLVVRETRRNRAVADEYRHYLRSAYPASGFDALNALERDDPWPGAALIWAIKRRDGNGYRFVGRR